MDPAITPPSTSRCSWRYGNLLVREAPPLVLHAGEELPLDRSGHAILCELLRHAGEVVTKDELLVAGWPGRIVSENSLAKAISRLRSQLGEDGAAIRSAHGYGYRLDAAVQSSSWREAAGEAEAECTRWLPLEGEDAPGLPGWRLERCLGRSDTSVVMQARSTSGDVSVLKYALNATGARCIRREVALHRYLSSAGSGTGGLVPVLRSDTGSSPPWLEMPLYPQGDLLQQMTGRFRSGPLELKECVALVAGLCDAVADLHGLGIIHKDIKPANLYLVERADGRRLLLGDLGAARMNDADLASLSATLAADDLPDACIGTAAYMAPEILAGAAPDEKSDIYAIGVLMLQMFSGNPFITFSPGWEVAIDDPILREDIRLAAGPASLRPRAGEISARLRALRERTVLADELALSREILAQKDAQLARQRARRRWWILASACLGIGMASTFGMYLRANRALHASNVATLQKQAVVTFLNEGILQRADPYEQNVNHDSLRRAVLAAATDMDATLGTQPDVAAEVHGILGAALIGLRDYENSVLHYNKALAFSSQTTAEPQSIHDLHLGLCDAARAKMDFALARDACGRASEIAARHGLDPTSAMLEEGQLLFETGQCDRGIPKLEAVLARAGEAMPFLDIYEATYYRALCLQELGRYEESIRSFRRILDNSETHRLSPLYVAWLKSDLGYLLAEAGAEGGRELLEDARQVFQSALPDTHPDHYAADYGLSLMDMQAGRWGDAATRLRRTHAVESETLGKGHLWTLMTCADLAWTEAELGNRGRSLRLMSECMRAASTRVEDFGTRYSFLVDRWIRTALALDEIGMARPLLALQQGLVERLPASHARRLALLEHQARVPPGPGGTPGQFPPSPSPATAGKIAGGE